MINYQKNRIIFGIRSAMLFKKGSDSESGYNEKYLKSKNKPTKIR